MTLFEGYLWGMFTALGASLTNRRALLLALFYATVIVSFKFKFVPEVKMCGVYWFLLCAGAQGIIGVGSIFIRSRASIPLALFSLIAVIVNVICFKLYPSQNLFYDYYFGLINMVQTIQVGALIFYSPLGGYLFALATGRLKKHKDDVWMLRQRF